MRHRDLGGGLACALCLHEWIAANGLDPLTNTQARFPEDYTTHWEACRCAREVAKRLNLVSCLVKRDGSLVEIIRQPV